jgi:CRISPR system Cascade subunit CasE
MFLSRTVLDTEHKQVRDFLASRQRIHAVVLSCFDAAEGRILWRLDELNGKLYLLVVSLGRPKADAQLSWQTKPYHAFLERIQAGQTWRFRLTANPTKAAKALPGQRGKVFGCQTAKLQEEWLLQKSEKCGFSPQFQILQRGTEDFFQNGNPKRVELTVATYEGVLTVTDAERFRAALVNGIGRAKGYGCGLLTVVGMDR